MLCNEARSSLGHEEHRLIDDLLKNLHDADTLNQIDRVIAIRKKLFHYHIHPNQATNKLKDIMFLDICLENYVKTLCDRIVHIDIGFKSYLRQISQILDNLRMSF
jgi:hypothetical protein